MSANVTKVWAVGATKKGLTLTFPSKELKPDRTSMAEVARSKPQNMRNEYAISFQKTSLEVILPRATGENPGPPL